MASTVKLAAATWLMGPLPLILTNAAFMKLQRVFVASYAVRVARKAVNRGCRSWIVPALTSSAFGFCNVRSQFIFLFSHLRHGLLGESTAD